MTPEFTVVVPTRRDSGHLRRAIESALRQRADLEVLLVHDRRPGEPPLPATLSGDPRVKILEASSPGPAAARNAGLRAARGRLVAFLDDDDLWLPGHLEAAGEAFAADQEAALVGADAYRFDDASVDGSAAPPDVTRLPRLRPERTSGRVSRKDLLRGNPFVTPAVVLVRDRLRPEDRFDESLAAHEDYDLWLRLARDRVVRFQARPGVIVRFRRGSLSGGLRVMASTAIVVLERAFEEAGGGPRRDDRSARVSPSDLAPPADLPSPAERRRRLGRLWHELGYACLLEDDTVAARAALRQSIRRLPLHLKNYIYWGMTLLPASLRRAAFRSAAGERPASTVDGGR